MYGSYSKNRKFSKKGSKYKGKKSNYSKFGKKHGTRTVITKYKW